MRANLVRTRLVPVGLAGVDFNATGITYTQRILALFGSSVISYLPLDDAGGATARDASGNGRTGVYAVATGVTFNQPGIGDGGKCVWFPGAAAYINWYSTSLRDAFNGNDGSLGIWCKVNTVAVWADGLERRPASLYADVGNNYAIRKRTNVNYLRNSFNMGGASKDVDLTPYSYDGWFHIMITWSDSLNYNRAYLNGVEIGVGQVNAGVFINPLTATTTTIGAQNTTPAQVWHGWLAHALLLNRAATPGEIAVTGRV